MMVDCKYLSNMSNMCKGCPHFTEIKCLCWWDRMKTKLSKVLPYCPPPFAKAGDIKTHSSICLSVSPSVCHKNFNMAHIFWSINDRALIFGMHDPCDKPFLLIPCDDLDLWPTSRSNLLPGGGPQFFKFYGLYCQLSHLCIIFVSPAKHSGT